MDEAVRALAADTPFRGTLVAIGGYGRGLLAPASDIDLMVLHEDRRPERVRAAAERVFYPLWDAGFEVGHGVRTVKEAVALARERVDVATALLDLRVVAGEQELAGRLRAELSAAISRELPMFLSALEEDRERRREAYGSCSHLLEPDVKESVGGLRDVHLVGWVARMLGEEDSAGLVRRGLLRREDPARLDDSEELFVRVRSALHLETGRRTDRVLLEQQPALARAFGFDATAGLGARDVLMRALFEHARFVEHVAEGLLARAAGPPPARTLPPAATIDDLLEAFADAASRGEEVSPTALDDLLSGRAAPPPLRWGERAREAFLRILRTGEVRMLESLDRAEMLVPLLPAWGPVRCRPQRDPYHRSTVDVHLLDTVSAVAKMLRDPGDDPVAAAAIEAVKDTDALLLGALLHDIGKTGEGEHVEAGLGIAEEALTRMGVGEGTADHVLFLVGQHLLLADTATRRDLTDQDLVLDVAAAVGDPERLAMLYLLTVADASSTGPLAWTPWRRALVRELVSRVQRVLDRGEMDAGMASDLADRTEAIRASLGEAAGVFLSRVPRAYLLAVPPERAVRDAAVVSPRPGATEVRTLAAPGDRPGTYDLTVVAADRRGLLASIAGALSLHGIGILSARAFTAEDGTALDLFVVEGMFDPEIDEERWRRFRSDLRHAIEGRASLDHRVREKRKHYPRPDPSIPLQVTVDTVGADFATVIEVSAADRIGLLFDLASVFRDLDLDVHVAKVATFGPRVIDAFYVRDDLGEKVTDARLLEEIREAITSRLDDA